MRRIEMVFIFDSINQLMVPSHLLENFQEPCHLFQEFHASVKETIIYAGSFPLCSFKFLNHHLKLDSNSLITNIFTCRENPQVISAVWISGGVTTTREVLDRQWWGVARYVITLISGLSLLIKSERKPPLYQRCWSQKIVTFLLFCELSSERLDHHGTHH